jgi:hypothetical protein
MAVTASSRLSLIADLGAVRRAHRKSSFAMWLVTVMLQRPAI